MRIIVTPNRYGHRSVTTNAMRVVKSPTKLSITVAVVLATKVGIAQIY